MFGFKKKREDAKLSKSMKVVFLVFIISAGFLQLWKFHMADEIVELKGQHLNVLVAKTIYHQYKGLGKRDSIEPYDGMIFPFAFEDRHGIVMRDMRFPIDIIWINGAQVVDFARNVPTEPGTSENALVKYYPRTNANIVLELPAGWIDENDLKIGDRIRLVN